jgi:hypothetical protein
MRQETGVQDVRLAADVAGEKRVDDRGLPAERHENRHVVSASGPRQ